MSQTLQIINIIVLVAAIGFGLHRLFKRKKKQEADEAEIEKWEKGSELATHDKEYKAKEKTNLQGKPYDRDEWCYTMPDAAIKHLQECFEGDEEKVYRIKRSIELSIEHYTYEMEDDAACAKIIEERGGFNPKATIFFDAVEYEQYRDELEKNGGEAESFAQWKEKNNENEGKGI